MINKSIQRCGKMQVSRALHVRGSKRLQINIYVGQKLEKRSWSIYGNEKWLWYGRKQSMHYALQS